MFIVNSFLLKAIPFVRSEVVNIPFLSMKKKCLYHELTVSNLGEIWVSGGYPEIKKRVLLQNKNDEGQDLFSLVETEASCVLIEFLPSTNGLKSFLVDQKKKISAPRISEEEGSLEYAISVATDETKNGNI